MSIRKKDLVVSRISLSVLPREILCLIVSFLSDANDLVACFRCCRLLSSLRSLSEVWKAAVLLKFPSFSISPAKSVSNSPAGRICNYQTALKENWSRNYIYNYYSLPFNAFMANVTMSISKLSEDKFLLVYGSNDTVTSNGQTKDFLVERTFTHRKSRNSPDCTPNGTIANIYGSNLYYSVAEKGLCKIGESIFTNFTNNKSHFGEIKSENTMVRACKENSPITQNLYIGSRILGLDSLFLEQNLYLVVISERSVNVWDTETLSQLAEYKARSAIVSFSVSVDRIAVATTNDRVYILRFRKTHDGHSLDCLKTFQLPKSKHAAVIALKGDYLVTATTTDDWTRTCLYDLTRNYGSDEPAQSAFKSTINAKIKFILLSTQYIIMTDKTQPKIYFISLTNNAKSNFEISIPVSNTSQQNTRISDIKLLSELCLLLVTTFGGVLHVYDFYGFERDGQTDKDRAVKDISANSSAEYLGAGIDFWKNSCLWDGDDGDEEEEVEYGNYGFGFVPRAQKRWRL